jgi:hypothetical protein
MEVIIAHTNPVVPIKFLESGAEHTSDRLTGLTSQHAMLLTFLFNTLQNEQQKYGSSSHAGLADLGGLDFIEIGGGFASMVHFLCSPALRSPALRCSLFDLLSVSI